MRGHLKNHSLKGALIFAAIGLSFLLLRAFMGWPSYPGEAFDFGNHVLFIARLLRGDVFPLSYNGILGSHLFTVPFVKLGMPITVAMQLLSDLSLLLLGFCVLWSPAARASRLVWALSLFLFVVLALPLISVMQDYGYYAQHVSYGFYAAAFCLRRRSYWASAAMLGWAGFCYPDSLMWVAPILLHPGNEESARPVKRAVFALSLLPALFLIFRQIVESTQRGGGDESWIAMLGVFYGGMLLYVLWLKQSPTRSLKAEEYALLCFAVVAAVISIGGYFVSGHFAYFARKSYFSLSYLPLLAFTARPAGLKFKALQAISLAALAVVAQLTFKPLPMSLADIFLENPERALTPQDEQAAAHIARQSRSQGCQRPFVLTRSIAPKFDNSTRLVAFNGMLSCTMDYVETHEVDQSAADGWGARFPERCRPDCLWVQESDSEFAQKKTAASREGSGG